MFGTGDASRIFENIVINLQCGAHNIKLAPREGPAITDSSTTMALLAVRTM
jgi:hypothetical protein